MFTAICRASSLVNNFAADLRPISLGDLLAIVSVADRPLLERIPCGYVGIGTPYREVFT